MAQTPHSPDAETPRDRLESLLREAYLAGWRAAVEAAPIEALIAAVREREREKSR